MKRNLLYLLMLVGLMSVFAACGNDDDDVKYPIDEEIAGVYKGKLDIFYAGVEVPIASDWSRVYISKAGNDAIKLELKNFSVKIGDSNLPIGDITVEECKLAKKGNGYEFSGSQALTILVGKCNIQVSGTIVGDAIEIKINVDAVDANLKVIVDFEGKKLIGNESSEAKILTFSFDPEKYEYIAEQPIIDEKTGVILFRMMDVVTEDDLKEMLPNITISEKATINPSIDEPQDFSNGKTVVYTVMAEDGTMKKYSVSTPIFNLKNDFETWMKGYEDENGAFYEPVGWTSSNMGANFLKLMSMTDKFVITKTEDAHGGKYAVNIETIDSQGADFGFVKVPKVTTGSLFLGRFVTDALNTLNSTKFGNEFTKKPKSLKGYFKYKPGETYYACESVETCHIATVDDTKTDKCAIKAVLYTTDAYNPDWSDCLTGVAGENNIFTSSRVVAIASLESGAKDSWTEFNVDFDYKKTYDPAKKYRLSISCSSSIDGDKFCGAPGSVLVIDDLELIVE